jgi:hypothetical protein
VAAEAPVKEASAVEVSATVEVLLAVNGYRRSYQLMAATEARTTLTSRHTYL